MNLLQDPWMPVRDAQGQRHWITPDQLADPRWLAFDADRPDFNGALAQFAIGLLQTTTPVADVIEWRGLMRSPPSAETLKLWFAPVAAAFDLDEICWKAFLGACRDGPPGPDVAGWDAVPIWVLAAQRVDARTWETPT